jgi:hypothetical protein
MPNYGHPIHDMYAPTEFGASPGRVSAVRNGSKRVKAADNTAAEATEQHRLTRRQTNLSCLGGSSPAERGRAMLVWQHALR